MKVDDINTIQDIQKYCEGFSTNKVINRALKKYTLRIFWLFENGKIIIKKRK